MKSSICTIAFAIFLTSVVGAEERTIGDTFRIFDAVKYVFVDEVPIGDQGKFGYKELEHAGEIDGTLKKVIKEVSSKSYSSDGSYPFVGCLAKLMLLDTAGHPICSIEVVNWDRTVVFKGVDASSGKNVISNPRVVVRSDRLCRWVYGKVRENSPDRLEEMRANYRKVGEDLETLLFPPAAPSEQGDDAN